MTKKRFFEILKEEGLSQESIDEIYASPMRPNINRLHEASVRATAKDTKIAMTLSETCDVVVVNLN
jgi:hypothetical protein